MKVYLSLFVSILVICSLQAAKLDIDTNYLQFLMEQLSRESQSHLGIVNKALSSHADLDLRSCACQNDTCGCCVHVKVDKIHLDNTVCLNVSYLKQEIGVEVALLLDNVVLFKEKVSAKNPPPICVDIPDLKKLASVCLRLYKLDYVAKHFSGCAKIEAKLAGIDLESLDLGCFNFPLAQLGLDVG